LGEASIAIVAVAYNRKKSLDRLLKSLNNASYPSGANVHLYISIDYSENNTITELANSFKWKHGPVEVLKHKQNLGLKKHILKCGSLLERYDALIMLEDDLYVTKNFYQYSSQAVEFYKESKNIAGISLYNHEVNVYNHEPFNPIKEDSDIYFFQMPSSWGQIFLKDKWKDFTNWLSNENSVESFEVPDKMKKWPESSWLKLYASFMVDQNLFFIYPHLSLSTNFNEVGTNVTINNTTYQTKLYHPTKTTFKFTTFSSSCSVYDIFFESISIKNKLNFDFPGIEIDFYGEKPLKSNFLLSSKPLNFKVIREYSLSLRPYEYNITNNIKGTGIYIYDTKRVKKVPFFLKFKILSMRNLYINKSLSFKSILLYLLDKLWSLKND